VETLRGAHVLHSSALALSFRAATHPSLPDRLAATWVLRALAEELSSDDGSEPPRPAGPGPGSNGGSRGSGGAASGVSPRPPASGLLSAVAVEALVAIARDPSCPAPQRFLARALVNLPSGRSGKQGPLPPEDATSVASLGVLTAARLAEHLSDRPPPTEVELTASWGPLDGPAPDAFGTPLWLPATGVPQGPGEEGRDGDDPSHDPAVVGLLVVPAMDRPPLPPLPPTVAEFLFLMAELRESSLSDADVLPLDAALNGEEPVVVGLRSALGVAVSRPLSTGEHNDLRATLAADPDALLLAGVPPAAVPGLVEHNPDVAADVLARLAAATRAGDDGHDNDDDTTPRTPENPWLAALLDLELSVASLETISALAVGGSIPKGMLSRYIARSLSRCERVDERRQNRLVRLVCVFLSNLIRTGAVDLGGLLVEIQAFTIQFARVRDAAALFRLLKSSSIRGKEG